MIDSVALLVRKLGKGYNPLLSFVMRQGRHDGSELLRSVGRLTVRVRLTTARCHHPNRRSDHGVTFSAHKNCVPT